MSTHQGAPPPPETLMRITLVYPSVGRKAYTPYVGRGRRSLAGLKPRREVFDGKPYQNITLVEFARGCNFKCDFCSITAFHNASQNHRPARDVVEEMERTGSKRFFVVDDNVVS